MSKKAIWITVEEPVDDKEMERVKNAFENTVLNEKYELILTDESIDF